MKGFLLGLAASVALSCGAQALDSSDQAAIRWIAKRQIKSLQLDQADAAYAYVSPSAHSLFPNKDVYLRAMIENFGSLVYATEFQLGDLRETSQGVAQEVQFSDRRGRPFVAFFFFENVPETGWVIKHMIMSAMPAKSV